VGTGTFIQRDFLWGFPAGTGTFTHVPTKFPFQGQALLVFAGYKHLLVTVLVVCFIARLSPLFTNRDTNRERRL
jgi:hypothetical protein